MSNELVFFEDGEQLINYLPRTKEQVVSLLIIPDLNMPKKDCREVLKVIKRDSRMMTIPVMIFSTSNAPTDARSAYELGANCT